jgi:hypothetical protein
MKYVLICLLISVNLLNAQIDDKFIVLDKESNYSFRADFNQKYQLFPQFNNLYQGFIVKPFERQGYYAWLQLKQDGALRDTIVWLETSDVNSIISRLPESPKNPESNLIYNDIINRAKFLSVERSRANRLPTKEYTETFNGGLVRDTTIRYNADYADEKELRQRNLMDSRWSFTTAKLNLEKFSIVGKSANELILLKDGDYKSIRINEIQNIKFKAPSQALLGVLAGIPIGAMVGYGVGTMIFKRSSNSYFDFTDVGYVICSIGGAALCGTVGGIIANIMSKRPDIEIEGKTEYDRYFDFDRKTYFAIPEIKLDSSVKAKIFVEADINGVTKDREFSLKDSPKLKGRPVDTTIVSFGVGLADPLLLNFHIQFYLDENLGVLYTGLPVGFSPNDNEESSRIGFFYRIYHNYKFRHNVGLSVGFGKTKNIYYFYPDTYTQFSNYTEVGAFYEISFYGFFGMGGLYYRFQGSNSNGQTLNYSPMNLQIGYRFTI